MILAAAAGYSIFTDLAIWSGVVFIALVIILIRFANPPLVEAMEKRQAAIVESLRQAEAARAEMQRALDEQQRMRERARAEALEMIAEAKRDADRVRREIVERATNEIERSQARVQREVTLARQKAVHELLTSSADLSVRLAERILRSKLSTDDHRALVGAAIDDISRSAGGAA